MNRSSIYRPIVFILLSIICLEIRNRTKLVHPDAGLSIVELLYKYEYPVETHEVVTDDGYILTLHRIPHGKNETNDKHNKTPVLLIHGFLQSAIDFVVLGPEKSLSLLLADRNYDVWLGNLRGTPWSRKHKFLDPDADHAFWDYSLHEISLNDLPAFVDYILNNTSQDSLHYVGYSQGTTAFFIMASEKVEFAQKVKLMTALAPALVMDNPQSPILQMLGYGRGVIEKAVEIFNIGELFSRNSFLTKYLEFICTDNSVLLNLCLHHLFITHGYNYEGTNKSMMPLIYSHTPTGVSSKHFLHLMQFMENGFIHQYGGTEKYNVSKIDTPIALYYSNNDWAVNIKNVNRIVESLPNVVKSFEVPVKTFNHGDYVHSPSAAKFLYSTVIEEMFKFDNRL